MKPKHQTPKDLEKIIEDSVKAYVKQEQNQGGRLGVIGDDQGSIMQARPINSITIEWREL